MAPMKTESVKVTKVTKVTKAAKVAREDVKQAKHRNIRTCVHLSQRQDFMPMPFFLACNPKNPRRSTPRVVTCDDDTVVKHPHTTETCMEKIEDDNTLVLIVDNRMQQVPRQACRPAPLPRQGCQGRHSRPPSWCQEGRRPPRC
eukprot:TRINITY_DN1760_c0_g5_i3.p1 TRINITY_DN1760_c0_g5~~TRINITY_DN1760_c0_g5_i3.p1  ORF type:complete len:144 (+),score=21.39 TRINITY_DN1760_c0_g5_i3:727-1158(+)